MVFYKTFEQKWAYLRNEKEFFFIGRINGTHIKNTITAAEAYLLWESHANSETADQVLTELNRQNSSISAEQFRESLLNIDDDADWQNFMDEIEENINNDGTVDSTMQNNTNNRKNKPKPKRQSGDKKSKPKAGIQKQIFDLIREGKTFREIEEAPENEHLVDELMRHSAMYINAINYYLSKKEPKRIKTKRITDALVEKYVAIINSRADAFLGGDGNHNDANSKEYLKAVKDAGIAVDNFKIFVSWHNYNLAEPEKKSNDDEKKSDDHVPKRKFSMADKGKLVLWCYGKSGTKKSTVIEDGFQAIGHVTMEMEYNAGWCESFVPKTANILTVDGFQKDTIRSGFTLQTAEKFWQGDHAEVKQRGIKPPRTSGECWYITSNYHPRKVWGEDYFRNVIKQRTKRLALLDGFLTGVDLCNVMLEANGKAVMPEFENDSDSSANYDEIDVD